MAKSFKFRKPNMGLVWSEITMLAIWLFFGERILSVVSGMIGDDSGAQSDCTNGTIFEDAYEFLGLGNDCTGGTTTPNSDNGLLGIVALIMVVAIIMNFIQYR